MVLGQKQSQILSQKMIMNRQMINAVKLLNLSSEELQEEIVKEVKKNPALIFKTSAFVGAAAAEAGNKHQEFLENIQDESYKTLQTDLLEQARETIQNEYVLEAAVRIIQNLDKNGFNWVPVEELFNGGGIDSTVSADTKEKKITNLEIKKALNAVRRLEPIGCACSGFKQTLIVQARIFCESSKTGKILDIYKNAYKLTVDIIKNHYEILSAISDINLFMQKLARKKISATQEEAEEVIELIKSLNPYPGQKYSEAQGGNKFIVPVAEIKRDGNEFKIMINDEEIPSLEISPEYERKKNTANKKEAKEIAELLHKAELFMEVLAYRNRTILKIITVILKVQKDFFIGRAVKNDTVKKVHGYLKPLKQADVAAAAGLHPSTVSRICNEKYIRCEWGLFEIKDLFSGRVSGGFSKDYVLSVINDIIESETQKIPDIKISQVLKERGITIAPRTVNKYRKELCLPSSYYRQP